MNRKRIQNNDATKKAIKVANSAERKPVNTPSQKDKELNYLNKPHLQFK